MAETPLVLSILSALIALAAAAYSSRSWPIGTRKALLLMDREIVEVQGIAEALQSKWAAKVIEIADLTEQLENLVASVEKKRRQTAASGPNKQGGPVSPEARHQELLGLARAAGVQGL